MVSAAKGRADHSAVKNSLRQNGHDIMMNQSLTVNSTTLSLIKKTDLNATSSHARHRRNVTDANNMTLQPQQISGMPAAQMSPSHNSLRNSFYKEKTPGNEIL